MTRLFASITVLGLLSSGCATHDENKESGVYGARQEGNLDAAPGRDTRQPYTPVMGDTTGDGMRRDMRTGGGITGPDVTPTERINQADKTRTNAGGVPVR